MQKDNYLIYLEKTAAASPDKVKKHLVRKFIDADIAFKSADMNGQMCLDGFEFVDISNKNLTEQLISCLHQSEKARIIYEQWEFVKDYKYSVIFTCSNFDNLLRVVSSIEPLNNECENEYILDTFTSPVAYHTDELDFLKFNIAFAAIHPLSQEEFLQKYPFLVVLHRRQRLIEFRFDIVKRLYISEKRDETKIYADFISAISEYMKSEYKCELEPLNMDFMVNVGKNEPGVKLIAQYMKLPSGGNAQLEVGNNQEYVLPLIGELKSLLADNKSELETVPTLREALEQFMFEMEEMSDYPWIELLWENEIKTRSIHVKFVFNYMSHDYCLIQHYYSSLLIGMERMNYVIKYISSHRNDDTNETE